VTLCYLNYFSCQKP